MGVLSSRSDLVFTCSSRSVPPRRLKHPPIFRLSLLPRLCCPSLLTCVCLSRLSAVYLSAFKLQHSALFVYVSITLLVEGQPPPAARRLAAEGKTSRVNSAYVNAYVNLIFVPNLLLFVCVFGVATVYVNIG